MPRKNIFYHRQIANPYVEICTMAPNDKWIRISDKTIFDDNIEVKKEDFAIFPLLEKIYQSSDSPEFTVFYLANMEATVYSMTAQPQKIEI